MGFDRPDGPSRYLSENFYGATGALSFNLGLSKDERTPAIHVDCAVMKREADGDRAFADWKEKASIMLSMGEACVVLAACLGLTHNSEPRFDFHGGNRNKSLSLVWRDDILHINFTRAGDRIGVPLQRHHRIQLANFILTHYLHRLVPTRTQTEWLQLLKLSAGAAPAA